MSNPSAGHTNDGTYLPAADITLFKESSLNPRRTFDKKKLQELAESIGKSGQLTPVTARIVASKKEPHYELASGHRRFRALQLLGVTTIRAVVKEMTDAEFIEVLNVDNLQREDVHPLEEAEGYKNWLTVDGMNVDGIMAKTGKSESYVYDRLKLLALIKPAQKLFLENRFTAGHAILLARLSSADQKRCLDLGDDSWDRREGGMWQRHHGHAPVGVDETLELADGDSGELLKPVSVRELQTWIDDHCRFEKPDASTPHLFAETAENLAAVRAMPKPKLVEITRSYVLKDDVKDPDRRVLTSRSWTRADGEPEEPEYAGAKAKASKTCDYSVMGLVVAGEGRGESFLVCINKKKCTVHYGAEVKAHNKCEADRRKAEKGGKSSAPTALQNAKANAKAEKDAAAVEAERLEVERRDAAFNKAAPAIEAAVVAAVKKAPADGKSPVAAYLLESLADNGAYGIEDAAKKVARLGLNGNTPADWMRRTAAAVLLIRFDNDGVEAGDKGSEFLSDLADLKLKIDVEKLVVACMPPAPKPKEEKKPTAKITAGKKAAGKKKGGK